jgi:hypothetical protein
MTDQTPSDKASPWPTLAALSAWLIKTHGSDNHNTAMRLLKIAEKFGEATQASIGKTGQNPRKGRIYWPTDIADELCDLAITALVTLHDYVDDPAAHFTGKLVRTAERALGPVPPPDAPQRHAQPLAHQSEHDRTPEATNGPQRGPGDVEAERRP